MRFLKKQFDAHDTGEAQGVFSPQLTSLVDIMAILIIFLVKNFSIEGAIVTPADDLLLPVSTSQKAARAVTTLEVTTQSILSEGTVLANIQQVEKAESLMIPTLFDWMRLQKASFAANDSTYEVMIQSDREIPFSVVKKIMFTCSKAGFTDYSILVLQED